MGVPVPGKVYRDKFTNVLVQVTRVTRGKIPAFGGSVDVEYVFLCDLPNGLRAGVPRAFGTVERFSEVFEEAPRG